MIFSQIFTIQWNVQPQMVLSFLLNVFSISVCHCLKSVTYKKVCVCVCVCVCVRARARVRVMQDVPKIKIIQFL